MSTTTTNLGLFKYDTSTDAQLAFNINQALNGNWDILDKSTLNGDIITLGSSGTQALTNNRIHKITCNGNTTFSLPTGSGTEFKEIVVLLYMPTAYSISLGTSVYFGDSTPDMSNSGYYTIIYEYDPIRSSWVVGVLSKETSGSTPVEYPWTQPMLTANGVMGGDSFAVSTPNTEYAPNLLWHAFDNSSSTYCLLTAIDYVVTVICYNPVPLKLSSFSYLNINSSAAANRTPISGIIYGGNDNLTWTQINDFTNSSTGSGVEWSQAINSSSFYNYYKFEFVLKTQSTTPQLYCMNMTLTGTYLG